MKILLINNFHYRKGGSEAVYFNTADLLRQYGHEVVFFSYKREENLPCEQDEFFVEPGGTFLQLRSYFYNRKAAKQLEMLIKKEQPDIAHVHLFWGGLSPSIFKVLKKCHVPLVHTAHDYRMVCPGYTFKNSSGKACERCQRWNYYECALCKCSKGSLVQSVLMAIEMYTRQLFYNPIKNIDGFIFVSRFSEQKHIEHHPEFKNSKRVVLYNFTNPLLTPDINKKENYFLYYGRLSFEKGIPTLLSVFAKHPELELKVVGTGPLEEKLKTEYKPCNNIKFIGYYSGKSLFELVRNARFVCVPSEWYENNPMTIIESYSLGSPVIGANIGGIPEIIEDGRTGFLFESHNTGELEKSVIEAHRLSENKYEEMCNNAYYFFETNFSSAKYYEKLINFYGEIKRNYDK